MASKPKLTVIPGGAAGQVQGTFISTGVMGPDGKEYFRAGSGGPSNHGGGGGGDDMKPLWELSIPRDVQIAKWGLATLFVAFGTSFLYFVSEFKDVRKDVSEIRVSVGKQETTTGAINDTLRRIEDKLDNRNDQPEGGSREGQVGTVHQGTPAKP